MLFHAQAMTDAVISMQTINVSKTREARWSCSLSSNLASEYVLWCSV